MRAVGDEEGLKNCVARSLSLGERFQFIKTGAKAKKWPEADFLSVEGKVQ
jgi:hypothetical protein